MPKAAHRLVVIVTTSELKQARAAALKDGVRRPGTWLGVLLRRALAADTNR